jgi:hypothetical protein
MRFYGAHGEYDIESYMDCANASIDASNTRQTSKRETTTTALYISYKMMMMMTIIEANLSWMLYMIVLQIVLQTYKQQTTQKMWWFSTQSRIAGVTEGVFYSQMC